MMMRIAIVMEMRRKSMTMRTMKKMRQEKKLYADDSEQGRKRGIAFVFALIIMTVVSSFFC